MAPPPQQPHADTSLTHASASSSASSPSRPRAPATAPNRDEETRRSLQALGKPYPSAVANAATKSLPWDARQRRDEAARILDSDEVLLWLSAARSESVSQTRAHYRNVLLGLEACAREHVVWCDEWEEARGQASPGRGGKGKEREIARMRRRGGEGL